MTQPHRPSQALNIILWIAQVVLAAGFIWAAATKLLQPIDKLAAMWPWVAQVPAAVVKGTGVVDLLAGIGLVLPALLRIRPNLTPVAAVCVVILMICASVFHISRGEASVIGVNIFFAVVAAFIAWGRFRKAPIASK